MDTARGTIKVLLVEDQDIEAMLVSRVLRHAIHDSFTVEHANSLADAFQMLAANDFDVCLLDLGLPDGVGIDSLHQLRSVDARLPIVVLTGSDDERLGLNAIENGAQDFLAKESINGRLLIRSLRFAITRQRKMLGFAADAHTDLLTGMPNRRRLDQSFGELMANCDQLCLALLDIDHFKQINDTHGHLVGDQVLRCLATVIHQSSNNGIQAARFGGEEFALLLPETSVESACEIINDLLTQIADSPLDIEDTRLRVTASAGVSEVGPGDSLEDTLRRTDAALYDAKRLGRNRVCVKTR